MIKFENTEVVGWEAAIRGMKAKGYRKTKTGYETSISVRGKTLNLGTYKTEEEAKSVAHNFRKERFIKGVRAFNLNENDGVVIHDKYIVFSTGDIFNLYGKKMIGHIDRCGYHEVILNGKQYRVHRLVAETFIPNPENKPCVNHKDGNKKNNKANNLEWCTYSENTVHAYQTGLEKRMCGEQHHSHKLTEKDVKYVKQVYIKRDKEFGAVALAKRFNVDRTTIHDIIRGKTWREVS